MLEAADQKAPRPEKRGGAAGAAVCSCGARAPRLPPAFPSQVPAAGRPPPREALGGRAPNAARGRGAAAARGRARRPQECSGPRGAGPARPRAPRRMIFGKKVLMANLVFILKLLTMIFLG